MAANPVANGLFVHNNSTPPEHPSLFSLFSLKGKTAIVTGAGAGIGLQVANGLAEAGANVAITYHTNTKTPERAAEIAQKYGVQSELTLNSLVPRKQIDRLSDSVYLGKAYQLDVRDAKAVEDTINQIVKEFNGRLDVVIANAGVAWVKGPMVDAPIDHYNEVVQVDLDGVFYCARAAAAHWRRQKEEGTDINGNKLTNFTYGSFVATSSMSGHIVNFPQMQAAYNAAKAGCRHLCKLILILCYSNC